VCARCNAQLKRFNEYSTSGSVPMALGNDNYYGYVQWLLVTEQVTWLECAAASLCWSTILVYYLEEPYGHLMLENVSGASARTQVRGNLFSFAMPWEDIEHCCAIVTTAAEHTREHRAAEVEQHWRKRHQVPHDEATLATLLNVHIVGGSVDLSTHLEGATMRPSIVEKLIALLRLSGYPGYEENGANSADRVRHRIETQYERPYGTAKFIPRAVERAISAAREERAGRGSLIFDKNATPAEPATSVQKLSATLRPLEIVAERSSQSMSEAHNEYGTVFQKYQTLDIQTGSAMLTQFRPQYIGMAHPFTWPAAVGGVDVPGQDRWRRPDLSDGPEILAHLPYAERTRFWPGLESAHIAGGAKVRIFDLTRSMSQRIEGQYRRDWNFVPGLWNLYFREQVNLGLSLKIGTSSVVDAATKLEEQDAAVAAADLYKKLTSGTYTGHDGKRRKIDGDTTKLPHADNMTPLQKKLLADFRFRTRLVPGTREVRTKMGHIGFWASVFYGQGIFITVTPSERHNYLAIRLSRYRASDPYVKARPDCMPSQARDRECARVAEERK
jgi:hypothetical protein